jgi:hypothetical protein
MDKYSRTCTFKEKAVKNDSVACTKGNARKREK